MVWGWIAPPPGIYLFGGIGKNPQHLDAHPIQYRRQGGSIDLHLIRQLYESREDGLTGHGTIHKRHGIRADTEDMLHILFFAKEKGFDNQWTVSVKIRA